MRIQKVSQAWYGMIMSGGLVLLLAILMLCPIVPDGASAAEMDTNALVADTADDEFSISIALTPRTEIDITPTPNGAFQVGTANLHIATDNPYGYDIFMTSANAGQTTLKDVNSDNDRSITSITRNTVGKSMTGNTWGYTINASAISDTSTFSAIPTNDSAPIKTVTAATSSTGDSYQLGFGVHIGMNLPTGTYTNSMVVSVITKPSPVPFPTNLTTMQGMTSDICDATDIGMEKVLIDTRNNKKYYVAKMKDGECWMQQNLALNLTETGLSASDTDIAVDWNSSSEYPPVATQTAVQTWNISDATVIQSRRGGHVDGSHSVNYNNYGNYYSWNAATAGTGGKIISGQASGSICPKGWKLPTNIEYVRLVRNYGSVTASNSSYTTGNPLYFPYAGNISRSSGNVENTNTLGRYWTSIPGSSSTESFMFGISSNSAPGYTTNYRQYGYSVRCVAR